MGRNPGKSLQYFYIVTDWETKVKLVRAKFGLEGIGCLISLYQAVYKEGYALPWGEDDQLLFSDSNGIGIDRLKAIIDFCFEKEIFNKGIFQEHDLLTSHGIQKQWLQVVKRARRKETDIPSELLLLSPEEVAEEGSDLQESVPGSISTRGKAISTRGKANSACGNATEQSRAEQRRIDKSSRAEPLDLQGQNSAPSRVDLPARPLANFGDLRKRIKKAPWPLVLTDADLERLAMRMQAFGADLGFVDYAIERVGREKPRSPSGLLKKGLIVYDEWIQEYAEAKKPQSAAQEHVEIVDEPEPCECGGKIKANRLDGVGKCVECGAEYTWDRTFRMWQRDELKSTG